MPHLRRFAISLLSDTNAADDLVQDCISRALSKLDQFRDGSNMRAWLFTILHNLHVEQGRRRNRAAAEIVSISGDERQNAAPPTQEVGLTVRDLYRALDELDDEHRQIILMIGVGELSYKQTAEILGIPVGTVMSRLARGRERLRILMAQGAKPALRRVK